MRVNRALFIVGLLAFAGVLSAGPLTWHFTDIVLGDGTTVTGSFVFDADTTIFSDLNMTTSGGTSVPGESSWVFNTNLGSAEANPGGITGFEAVDALSGDETGAHFVSLFSEEGPLMTDAGGTITLDFFRAGTCGASDCSAIDGSASFTDSGAGEFTAATTPEPGTLVLGGSVLLLAGLRRRLLSRG